MDSLAKVAKQSKAGVRRAISQLPKKLDATYDEAMKRIMSQDENDSNLAKKVLSWICFAYEPLRASQLQEALAIEQGYSDEDSEALIDPEFFVSICAGLVLVHRERQTVHLVHYTTLGYFKSRRQEYFPETNAQIAEVCLTALANLLESSEVSSDIFDSPVFPLHLGRERPGNSRVLDKLRQEKFIQFGERKFRNYAILRLVGHLIDASDEKLFEQARSLWSSKRFSMLDQAYSFIQPSTLDNLNFLHRYPVLDSIEFATFFGWTSEVARLLEQGKCPGANKSSKYPAICIAVSRGDDEIVSLLLNAGAQLDGHLHRGLWIKDRIIAKRMENTPLNLAIVSNRISTLEIILDSRPEAINHCPEDGWTALHIGARIGTLEIGQSLLQKGLSPNSTTDCARTPSHLVAQRSENNISSIADALVDRGADINASDIFGNTPLTYARIHSNSALREVLLKHSAIEKPDSQLIRTIETGSIERFKELLAEGVDVNVVQHNNYRFSGYPLHSALEFAIASHQNEMLDLLINNGGNPGGHSGESLYLAARSRNAYAIRALLENGMKVNLCHKSGGPLICLVQRVWPSEGKAAVLGLLIDYGADVNAKDKAGTLLYHASLDGDLETVKFLLDKGADVNIPGTEGTPVCCASAIDRFDIVKLLLEHSADLSIPLCSPMYGAAKHDNVKMAELLLKHGADINGVKRHRETPLAVAMKLRKKEMVRFLQKNHADVNAGARFCQPLALASRQRDLEMVRELLDRRPVANDDAYLGRRSVPLSMAVSDGHTDVVKLLFERGAKVEKTRGFYSRVKRKGYEEILELLRAHGAEI